MRKPRAGANSVRSVNYATSPLLASKTPPWRSRFIVVLVAAAFLVLLGRAVYVQILRTDFYQAQGEKRFVHKQSLPASRGRILDRNGLALATSVAMPTVQVDLKLFSADTAQRKTLARLDYEQRHLNSPRTLAEIWNNGFAHGYTMFQTRKMENLYFDVERPADATQVKL